VTASPAAGAAVEVALNRVELVICDLCLDGTGGVCNVPGCAFCRKTAPDISLRGEVVACPVATRGGIEKAVRKALPCLFIGHQMLPDGPTMPGCGWRPDYHDRECPARFRSAVIAALGVLTPSQEV
jgi:hypothetical protein